MITAALADLSTRMALTPNLRRALDFLAAHPSGEGLAERVEIDGKLVYAMLQVFETVMEETTVNWKPTACTSTFSTSSPARK